MDRGRSFLWLVPRNLQAFHIVQDKANSSFRTTLCVAKSVNLRFSFLQRASKDEENAVTCIRVGFDHQPKGTGLLSFGRDYASSDIVLRSGAYAFHQADLYIDPNSLDLMYCDNSIDGSTSLLFEESCERVGNWRAADDNVVAQAILPSCKSILRMGEASFDILWRQYSKESEFQDAKRAFLERELPIHTPSTLTVGIIHDPWLEALQKRPLNDKYPEQSNLVSTINIRTLLDLPPEIRYMIFKSLLLKHIVRLGQKWECRVKVTKKFRTVHGCVRILNLSHQLLNPVYSSHQLALEAADVFYRQNCFEIDIFTIHSFIWTLKNMPSLDPFDPFLAISRLRLHINCGGMRANPFLYTPYWLDCQFASPTRTEVSNQATLVPIVEYRWTDHEIESMIKGCTAITSTFPRLTDVEIYIRKEHMSFSSQQVQADANAPFHVLENLKPMIKELRERGTRRVRVLLLGRRWNLERIHWVTARDYEDILEDITAWWDEPTNEDDKLGSDENLEWVNKTLWLFNFIEEDWKRKAAIEGAVMRRKLQEAVPNVA